MRGSSLAFATVAACFVSGLGIAGAQAARKSDSSRDVNLYARLLAMTDSRTFDRALVDSALASSWAPLRAAASLAVGQVGATHGIAGAPRLRELLNDPDAIVASNAAYALGLLRDSSSVPSLAATLGGRPRVAREAAWALGEIGPPFPRMIELIEELIAYNLGPWLIFAFLPLQAGYLTAMLLRVRFCRSARPENHSH